MAACLQAIHDDDIIHNDLKPENFVCIGMRLCLIDFGIADRIELDHTSIERDIRCGTVNYMAPETISTHNNSEIYKVQLECSILLWAFLGMIITHLGRGCPVQIYSTESQPSTPSDPTYHFPFSLN